MVEEKNLKSYFSNKRVPTKSPRKKRMDPSKATPKPIATRFLSLKDLFSAKSIANETKPLVFLSAETKINAPEATITPLVETKVEPPKTPSKPPRTPADNRISTCKKQLFTKPRVEKSKTKQPAHERFKHLYSSTETRSLKKLKDDIHASASLYLPKKYQRLYDMFVSVDTVLYIHKKRQQSCEFEKLKKSVEGMIHMVFTKNHLAQMLFLLPTAYHVYLSNSPTQHEPRLIVEMSDEPEFDETDDKLTSYITERRCRIRDLLLQQTLVHHREYLLKLGVDIDSALIKKWHPRFRVEEVPDIEMADLPEPPKPQIYTAQEMLKLVCFKDDENILKALEETAKVKKADTPPKKPPSASFESTLMKLIPKNILERVREKERILNEKEMFRDPDQEELLAKLQRLPDIMRTVYNYFVSEDKPYLLLEKIVDKIQLSVMPYFTSTQIQQHVQLINTHLPDWLILINLHGEQYVGLKLDHLNINQAIQRITQHLTRVQFQ